MTPPTREEIERMLSRPGVTMDDVDEYERLKIEQQWSAFSSQTGQSADAAGQDAKRDQLASKLFGEGSTSDPTDPQ